MLLGGARDMHTSSSTAPTPSRPGNLVETAHTLRNHTIPPKDKGSITPTIKELEICQGGEDKQIIVRDTNYSGGGGT